jgi:hypothetical protein
MLYIDLYCYLLNISQDLSLLLPVLYILITSGQYNALYWDKNILFCNKDGLQVAILLIYALYRNP